ncbi:MAG: hypothetical protein GC139_00410 [Sideroxydans sp.]|nr:hypothetical protein [Sideroxydans sp.]
MQKPGSILYRDSSEPSILPNQLHQCQTGLQAFFDCLKACIFRGHTWSAHRREVSIMYYGRSSEFLMVTSERMVLPDAPCTLKSILDRLRLRGARWAYELDDSHMFCEIDGKAGMLSSCVEPGAEIGIFSRKSIFEP